VPDIAPFRIAVPDDDLADLHERLARTRWPEAECVDDWTQGIPLSYTRELAGYWATAYDWRAREAALNRFDQFSTEIDGLDIHFIHQRSSATDPFPLLITHGWPGSVVEFHKVIEPLTEAGFDVVCPSLPGYGFSGKPSTTGWGVEKIAAAWETLMDRLGYQRYGAQGGDWGAAVTTQIGRNGGRCAATHTPSSSRHAHRPSATGWLTHPSASWHGLSRSSGRGWTATATRKTCCPKTSCSTT
jgi:hypothetical protein